MAKKKAEVAEGELDRSEFVKVAIGQDNTIINGHKLPAGCVVELHPSVIDAHRDGGVPLEAVAEHDDREVFDVHVEPPQVEEKAE